MSITNSIFPRIQQDLDNRNYEKVAKWLRVLNYNIDKNNVFKARIYTPAILRYIYDVAGQVDIIQDAFNDIPFNVKLYVIPEYITEGDIQTLFINNSLFNGLSDMTTLITLIKERFPDKASKLIDDCVYHCFTQSYEYMHARYNRWFLEPSLKEDLIQCGVRNINKWNFDVIQKIKPFELYLNEITEKKLLTPKRLEEILDNSSIQISNITALYQRHQHTKYETIWLNYFNLKLPIDNVKSEIYGVSHEVLQNYIFYNVEQLIFDNLYDLNIHTVEDLMSVDINNSDYYAYIMNAQDLSSEIIYELCTAVEKDSVTVQDLDRLITAVTRKQGVLAYVFNTLRNEYQMVRLFNDENAIEDFWDTLPDRTREHWSIAVNDVAVVEESELHL